MADVAKVGQDSEARKIYDMFKKMPICGGEITAANVLTDICNKMAKDYDQIIADQNDYLVDIEVSLDEISDLEADLETKVEQLEKEQEELLKKKEGGTITEEEEAELLAKNDEITNLNTQAKTQIDTKNNEINKTTQEAGKKEDIAAKAKDYGETAIEKGQPLSETKDKKKSFWRKLFGGWNKQAERDAGKKLLEAGNGLLEQVNTSSEIDNEIAKKTKKSV